MPTLWGRTADARSLAGFFIFARAGNVCKVQVIEEDQVPGNSYLLLASWCWNQSPSFLEATDGLEAVQAGG